jgi:hypothetical protein
VSPVKYELGFYIPEDDILHSHRRENLKPPNVVTSNTFLFHFWKGLKIIIKLLLLVIISYYYIKQTI